VPTDTRQSGLASSLTDLMTSLAVIFILLLCAALHNAQQEGENTRNTILMALKKELQSFMVQGVKVEPDHNDPLGLIILVPEGLLAFEFNRAEVPSEGKVFLQSFIPKLSEITCSDKFRGDISSIVVEGHTDTIGSDQRNLELSQQRSMSVVNKSLLSLDNQGDDVSAIDNKKYFLKLLSATGRGKAEPIIDDKGNENRDESRRVIFKIRVRSFEEKKITSLIESKPK
jgi:outer membrane protein OmpA-like peptidoglycan-associated protein